MKATLVLLTGIIILAFGTLFTLQGAGVVHWPPESFMIDQRDWIERGVVVALAGLALILTAWRIRR
jgi:drug/metabolite transporter superfamily protein YnfA